jgi:hypothetical protein
MKQVIAHISNRPDTSGSLPTCASSTKFEARAGSLVLLNAEASQPDMTCMGVLMALEIYRVSGLHGDRVTQGAALGTMMRSLPDLNSAVEVAAFAFADLPEEAWPAFKSGECSWQYAPAPPSHHMVLSCMGPAIESGANR